MRDKATGTRQSLLGSNTGWTSPFTSVLELPLENLALRQKWSFKKTTMEERQEVIISLTIKQMTLLIK